jgi:TctA family transporter
VYSYSRIVLLIAIVLGPLAEENFLLTFRLAQTNDLGYLIFVARPAALIIIAITLISIVLMYKQKSTFMVEQG